MVDQMIASIFPYFEDVNERGELETIIAAATPSPRYQTAMKFLIETRGQAALNDLVRESVLKARQITISGADEATLERELSGWVLAPGVESIGRLAAHFPDSFVSPLLTTNFDPLLEIAIRKGNGVQY
jgi:hypothetical protein